MLYNMNTPPLVCLENIRIYGSGFRGICSPTVGGVLWGKFRNLVLYWGGGGEWGGVFKSSMRLSVEVLFCLLPPLLCFVFLLQER